MADTGTQAPPGAVESAGSPEPAGVVESADPLESLSLEPPDPLEPPLCLESTHALGSTHRAEPTHGIESTTLLESLRRLTDAELVARVEALARREHGDTALLVAHLAELDTREWFLRAGYSSLFTYCRDALALSEHESYNRIEVARAARRYPAVVGLLASGAVNLTTVRLLAPHLTPDNHASVLESARGKKRSEVEEIVASLAPFPEVPPSIRRLPPPRPAGPTLQAAPEAERIAPPPGTATPVESPGQPFAAASAGAAPIAGGIAIDGALPAPSGAPAAAGSAAAQATACPRPRSPGAASAASAFGNPSTPSYPPPEYRRPRFAEVTPLAPDRYRLQCTIGGATLEKFRLAQDLLRHAIPSGDEAAVLDRAFTALLAEIARTRFAAVENPQPARGTAPGSRHVPAEVKRAVWVRDLGRCAFVGTDGRRCNERAFVEFHHVRPYAAGGEATVDNIQLRCRRHNAYESRTFFDRGMGAEESGVLCEPRAACDPSLASACDRDRLVSERVRMSGSNGSNGQARRDRAVEDGIDAGCDRPPPHGA